ncbi:PaaI family thioesterase [Microbacterium sp. CFH 31415]|uniref:PaaI family thioesterase n=1 Tax=Microbacterium sp. CFH 31415 TaxID=2921732 RepID=UPI001F1459DB|nr:PaaI family thioesterase [Microbacterium sp. CFH 31415]MCH6231626.1 PaaI family thioesterase [Microbacterium sp. CFH 31415]
MDLPEREYGPSPAADELMTAMRELIRAATTTAAASEEMVRITQGMRDLTADLDRTRHARARRIPFTPEDRERIQAGAPWRMFPYTPQGIPQEIVVTDAVARSRIQLTAAHEGPPGMLHGGFGAAIMDALLGVLVMAECRPAVTVELTTRFLRPTPLDCTVEAVGRVVEQGPRRIIAEGSIEHDGVPTVTARGVFVPYAMPAQPAG